MSCLHLHTVIVLYRLYGNDYLLDIFVYPSNHRAFSGPELNLEILVFFYMFLECEIAINCDFKKIFTRASFYQRTFNVYGFKLKDDTNE